MARKDRSFTGRDIARLYCKNLSEADKDIAAYFIDNCGSVNLDEIVLRALADKYKPDTARSLFFEAVADLIEGGDDLLAGVLEFIRNIAGDDTLLLPPP